jgi:hypothetical protein
MYINLDPVLILLFQIYTRVLFYITNAYKHYRQQNTRVPFFAITAVHCDGLDITDCYLYEGSYDLEKYPRAIIDWNIGQCEYKFVLTPDSCDHFPPYSFHSMKTPATSKTIVSAFLKDTNGEVQSVGKLIKKLAGPKQSFYRDAGSKIMTSDIWGLCDKTLTLVTTVGMKDFDLTKDNILEL